MISQIDIDAFELPDWASKRAEGDYTLPNASLPTRDGRVSGNAVMIGISNRQYGRTEMIYTVITDSGNVLYYTENELKYAYYPPKWVMTNLLPAHIKALQELDLPMKPHNK